MEAALIALIGPILEETLQLAESATSGQVSNIIGMLDGWVKVAATFAPTLISQVQGIITTLQGSAAVSASDIATLQQQSATLDAALDAAAKDDGLTAN